MKPYRAVLCGYYGFGNLGDELLASALVEAFERIGVPGEELAILSASPEETERSLGVRAVNRWKMRDVFKVLRESDSLLLGGGGLFQDTTSIRSPGYYWGVVRLASLAGTLPWAIGQSVGPFRSIPGTLFAKNALGKCPLRSVRDDRSADQLATWGLWGSRAPDPAFLLGKKMRGDREKGKRLLVNIRPWGGSLPLRTVTKAAKLAAEGDLPIVGVGLSEADVALMEKLAGGKIFKPERIVLLSAANWRAESELLFSDGAAVVSMRYHFALLALLSGVPLTLSAYDPKVEELALQWGLPYWKGEGKLPSPALSPFQERTLREGEVFLNEFRRMWEEVRRMIGKKRSVRS